MTDKVPIPVPRPDDSGIDESGLQRHLEGWAEKGLDAIFLDKERQNQLVVFLEEQGCPTHVSRPGVKLLAPLLCSGSKAAGKWIGKTAAQRATSLLLKLPGVATLVEGIEAFAGRIDETIEAEGRFEEVLAGISPEAGSLKRFLKPDLRAHLAELEKLDEIGTALADINATLQSVANPQPVLDLWLVEQSDASRFVYRSRTVPFAGRVQETANLVAFLSDDRDFCWHLLHGPGGMGKSRLALEFVIHNAGAFTAGFLSADCAKDFDWERWQPVLPTLMVVDYAGREAEQVGRMLRGLAKREDLECAVRVLLIERSAEGPWYDTITQAGNAERFAVSGPMIEEHLALEPLADPWPVIAAVIGQAGMPLPAREETLEILREIDPPMRPLYAAFLADALARGAHPRGWDRKALVTDVLEHEEVNYWRPAGVTPADKRLAVVVTMANGLPVEILKDLTGSASDGLFPAWNIDETPARLSAILGAAVSDHAPPLEPDILGEVFVLNEVGDDPSHVAVLRDHAWKSPRGMFDFLNRIAQDFPGDTPGKLFSSPGDDVLGDARIVYCMLVVNLINHLGASDMASARALYGELTALAAAHPDEAELRLCQAKAAVNLIAHLRASDMASARALHGELTALAAAHPDEAELRLEQAKAAFNLINHLGASDMASARALYDDLTALAAAHPDEAELRLEQAKAAFNLINHLRASDMASARALHGELTALAAAHPDEAELRLRQAKAAVNLINHLGASDMASARALYGELTALAAAHPREAELRLRQAQAAFNLINHLGASDMASARALYGELTALAAAHPDEAELRLEQAKAAFNLINHLRASDMASARALHGELTALAAAHPKEAELRLRQARAAVNLIIHLGASDMASARALYGELTALAAAHPDEAELRLEQAKAAVNLINHLGASDMASARALYGEIRDLAVADGNDEIREAWTRAGAAILVHLLQSEQADEANRFLGALFDDSPDVAGEILRRLGIDPETGKPANRDGE